MAVLSNEPVARVPPSRLKASEETPLPWPFRVAVQLLEAESHSLTVLSPEAVARIAPSGLKAMP